MKKPEKPGQRGSITVDQFGNLIKDRIDDFSECFDTIELETRKELYE